MSRRSIVLGVLVLAMLLAPLGAATAATTLYVDSAPNRFGSPSWAPWWTATKADVVAGTFTNLRTGTYAGTNLIDPYDEIVYSTGDLGKRLHWMYWLPGETIAALQDRFQVKWVIDWEGTNWTYDAGGWALDAPEVGWSQPASWENYAGGVIGSMGFAWWATDNEAPPLDTFGSPYDETNQADVDALRMTVLDAQTFATGYVRIRDSVTGPWETSSLQVNVVPLPSGLLLPGAGAVAGSVVARIRRPRRMRGEPATAMAE